MPSIGRGAASTRAVNAASERLACRRIARCTGGVQPSRSPLIAERLPRPSVEIELVVVPTDQAVAPPRERPRSDCALAARFRCRCTTLATRPGPCGPPCAPARIPPADRWPVRTASSTSGRFEIRSAPGIPDPRIVPWARSWPPWRGDRGGRRPHRIARPARRRTWHAVGSCSTSSRPYAAGGGGWLIRFTAARLTSTRRLLLRESPGRTKKKGRTGGYRTVSPTRCSPSTNSSSIG